MENKYIYKRFFLLIFLTLIFSVLIFIIKTNFFYEKKDLQKDIIEDNYIEPVKNNIINNKKENSKELDFNSASKFLFTYFPNDYKNETKIYSELIYNLLTTNSFNKKINLINIEFYKEKADVRGKMKDGAIKMFSVNSININEFLAVFIHEFCHYIDLYYLEKRVFVDPSYYFYNISWETTKVIKKGQKQSDFVSGYSMTNKYEDFAESLTYFILHNNEFIEKSKKSNILEEKYEFFRKTLFQNNEFIKTSFSTENEIKDYYWDITKIDIDFNNFLQYLKN